jgi:hypothetical protein
VHRRDQHHHRSPRQRPPLAALVESAWRGLAIADPTDDYLAELAAALLAAVDEHRAQAPSLLILATAITDLIDAPDRPAAPVFHALRVLAALLP